MSTLWTPDGERPVRRSQTDSSSGGQPGVARPAEDDAEPTEEELQAQMAEMRDQLARTPPEVVIANHAFGLFELAALHLSVQPPQLEQARTAIDALGALVEGMAGRLGEPEKQLVDGLAQLRLAFVEIRAAAGHAAAEGPGGTAGAAGTGG